MSDHTVASLDALTEPELALEGFLARYQGNTLLGYRSDLRVFVNWCNENHLDLLDVRRPHIDLFARYLVDDRGNGKASVYRRLMAIKGFYAYCVEEDFIEKSPARSLHPTTPRWGDLPPIALTKDEFQRMLHVATDPVDHALICLLGWLGLRVSEAVSINIGDYDEFHDGCRTLNFVGKGERPARAPVSDDLYEVLRAAEGGRAKGEPLLARKNGSRMPRRTAQRVTARLARAAGITKPVTPHCLRHTFVVAAVDAGVHMRAIQLAARHQSIDTTVMYDRHRQIPMTQHAAHDVQRFLNGKAS